MIKARCKFRVKSVTWIAKGSEEIKLAAEYDPDDKDDRQFTAYTPMGDMSFHLTNPELVGTFKPGDAYYIDLTPVQDKD